MKSFYKFTVKSPAASYIPLPRFLLQDEQLRDISNDAKVLYATRIFRELEYSSLINRKKQGLGKPAVITLNYPADAKLITKEETDESRPYPTV